MNYFHILELYFKGTSYPFYRGSAEIMDNGCSIKIHELLMTFQIIEDLNDEWTNDKILKFVVKPNYGSFVSLSA